MRWILENTPFNSFHPFFHKKSTPLSAFFITKDSLNPLLDIAY